MFRQLWDQHFIITAVSWQEIYDSDDHSTDIITAVSISRRNEYIPEESNTKPHLITKIELGDLVHVLYLSKYQEFLLQKIIFLADILKFHRQRDQHLMKHLLRMF